MTGIAVPTAERAMIGCARTRLTTARCGSSPTGAGCSVFFRNRSDIARWKWLSPSTSVRMPRRRYSPRRPTSRDTASVRSEVATETVAKTNTRPMAVSMTPDPNMIVPL